MKSTFAIACMAAATQASLIDTAKDLIAEIPRSRDDARAKYTPIKRSFKTNEAHQDAYAQAHHNVRAQRQRLGLAPLGARPDEEMRKSYEDMTGFSALVLGIAQGLQYNSAAGPNSCFAAVESNLTASSNLFFILSKFYLPWYVPEAQLVI